MKKKQGKTIRIYQLAKELNKDNTEVIEYLQNKGIDVSSHLNAVDAETAEEVKEDLGKGDSTKSKKKKKKTSKKKESSKKKEKKEKKESKKKGKKDKSAKESSKKKKAKKGEEKDDDKKYAPIAVVTPIGRKLKPRVKSTENISTKKRDSKRGRQSSSRSRRQKKRAKPKPPPKPTGPPKEMTIEEPVTVKKLSQASGIKVADIIKLLMKNGMMAKINDPVPEEGLLFVEEEYDTDITIKRERDIEEEIKEILEREDDPENLESKPPVVTFVGHVDHGKTSLLDKIRASNVQEKEAGGITQHIGAYSVNKNDKKITFIDTPGHEAFTEMRARGVNITDIVVLVVAADDGVMPQTQEAISHAKAADVPIVVALNKMDKPEANAERVRRELAENELLWDGWGGETMMVEVSAITGQGMDELIDTILTIADLYELEANPDREAIGTVIEAEISELRGAVATVIIQNGTLHLGDDFLCGATTGKVRGMTDYLGREVQFCKPGEAVEILGFNNVPLAADRLIATRDPSWAREVAEERKAKLRETSRVERSHVTLENLYSQIGQGNIKEVKVIIKADTQGSVEALKEKLGEIEHDEVRVNIIHSGVGGINVSDIHLADASDAIIVGFHVATDSEASNLSHEKKVEIKTYQVIYHIVEEIRAALEGMLEPEIKEVETARLEVRQVFKTSHGTVAGCYVKSGAVNRNHKIRVIRNGIVTYDSEVGSLRRFTDDVKEVKEGYECGLRIENFNDVKVGDELHAYKIEKIARTLS